MKKKGIKDLTKVERQKIAYLEPFKDNDNFINYQDLDVSQEKDEIYVVELQSEPPYILVKC